MNIKITNKWLSDYLVTDATPVELQKYLSLCGPSIERIEDYEDDKVYDIEITSNRIDTASVIGITQESMAILPMFGKKAVMKANPLVQYKISSIEKNNEAPLVVEIKDKSLCSRFTAVLIDNVKMGPSPKFISDRLKAVGIKSINNVVDISNYLMVTLGQPVHTFDFDKIGKGKMVMRESKKGEKLVTLDDKEINLPGGDIVIEDGNGDLIDLCGIMGGKNSAISEKTTRVLLFVQTYNKEKVRKTTMSTGQRTIAATYFEKGLDEERVEATTVMGVKLLEEHAQGKVASKVYDIFPAPYKSREIEVETRFFSKMLGTKLEANQIKMILIRLGFKVLPVSEGVIKVLVPAHRKYDVSIKEDLLEEVARIYGYHNVDSVLSPPVHVEQPHEMEDLFVFQNKVKLFLKHLGLNEVINYSMISKEMVENAGLSVSDHLRLSNSISDEIEYLRIYLTPSLLKNVKDNEGKRENLRLFEIGKVYKPQKGDLPKETYHMGIVANTSVEDIKGIVEALMTELNITDYNVKNSNNEMFDSNIQGEILIGGEWVGKFGKINGKTKNSFKIEKDVYAAYFNFEKLIRHHRAFPKFRPLNQFAVIKLDKTFKLDGKKTYSEIRESASKSALFQAIEVVSTYKDNLTIRFYYSSPVRNITEEEAKKELDKV